VKLDPDHETWQRRAEAAEEECARLREQLRKGTSSGIGKVVISVEAPGGRRYTWQTGVLATVIEPAMRGDAGALCALTNIVHHLWANFTRACNEG
jgi:hypothetical protein